MALGIESESVRTYLTLLQGVISRMAGNSAACKTWCVTIVSAIFVLAIDKNKPQAIAVGLLPVGLFFLLDAYYLSLERDFRMVHDSFVSKLYEGAATAEDVYSFKIPAGFGHRFGAMWSSIWSLSVLPFYGILVAALLFIRHFVYSSQPAG
jgi:hypothetical protein